MELNNLVKELMDPRLQIHLLLRLLQGRVMGMVNILPGLGSVSLCNRFFWCLILAVMLRGFNVSLVLMRMLVLNNLTRYLTQNRRLLTVRCLVIQNNVNCWMKPVVVPIRVSTKLNMAMDHSQSVNSPPKRYHLEILIPSLISRLVVAMTTKASLMLLLV